MTRSQITLRLDATGGGFSPAELAVLRPPAQLPDGRWRFDGLVARGGEIKQYPSGPERADFGELSRPEVVEAFEGLPVTVDHEGGLVVEGSPAVRADARVLRADAFADPQILRATFLFRDRPTSPTGLSVGWEVREIDAATNPPTQRGLVPNHVTIARRATPRSAGAGLRLDSTGGRPMPSITINTHTAEVPEAFASAWAREQEAAKTRLDAAEADKTKAEGDRDKASGELAALKAARLDATTIRTEALKLAALWAEARSHVKPEVSERFDAMTEREVKGAVIGARLPSIKLDATMSDETINGLYLGALAAAPKGAPAGAADIDGAPGRLDAAPKSRFMGTQHFNNFNPTKEG